MSIPFDPQPCADGGGGGGNGNSIQNLILCDLDPEGSILGVALAVYEYDENGNPVGPPTFVDPVTGLPYVVQGTLSICPGSECCPVVVGSGCTNVGSGFYTSIQATDGTVTFIDSVNGTPVLLANIIACPNETVVPSLTVVGNGCTNVGSNLYTALRSSAGVVTFIDSVTGAAVLQANIVACPTSPVVAASYVVGNGCTNVGSGFYTAIRSSAGVVTYIDSVSGAAVIGANIIPCPGDNVVKTLTSQARQLTNATPWTPGGDVAGTLTSLTVTGVSGLWDMVDQNGTVLTGLPAGLSLTWSVSDDNTLTGPTSVTPQSGASVIANWTQR